MSGSQSGNNSLKRKHWSIRAHETLISRNKEGHFCLNVEGGAEVGLIPYIGDLRQDKITYRSGRLQSGELVLEVNHKRVPGMIKKDVIALIKRSSDPVSLVTVKQNATITKDIRQYLATRFSKNSVDSELQHQIRENLHLRVVPYTTRTPREGERQGIDYNFISVEEFKRLDRNGELLESGNYEKNFYGTPKPPADPPFSVNTQAYSRSPANTGYTPREPLMPLESLSASGNLPKPTQRARIPPNPGPLPTNWEIAYTENNEKYFIDHNTGTTHWLDPRLVRHMKINLLDCEDDELPYGWERVNDPVYGVYFINHIDRVTQYENPVIESKRKFVGSQLPQRSASQLHPAGAPPPMRAPPPSFQTAAALEKQREAEAAAQWPNAGLMDYPDFPQYPQQPLTPRDMLHVSADEIEANLKGEVVKVVLIKNPTGFGFTIIGGDRPGELLQIRSIVRGGVADKDGQLRVGDVLVRVNNESVVTYNHHRVVDLFQSIPMHTQVELEVRRGYPLPDHANDELPSYSDANVSRAPLAYNGHSSDLLMQQFNDHFGLGPIPTPDRVSVGIVKGPLGFGFSLSETPQGPVVKQIMDIPRCAQLREGDLIVEVNNERVTSYSHNEFITLLKRCPKGNQANFVVFRSPGIDLARENPPQYTGQDGYPQEQFSSASKEPFQQLEVHLLRQVSGFGFRIIGGREEGSQATIGGIVAGGAADLDGRVQVGDEITHINNRSVVDALHRDVIQLMQDAGALGEVSLRIRRKMPWSASKPSYQPQESTGGLLMGPREVVIQRPNTQTSFGFVLQSNTLRTGCMICRLIPDSPAEQCGQLQLYDELLSVNGTDVTQMDHGDIVQIIKASSVVIKLVVQQPEDKEEVLQMQQIAASGDRPMQPAMAIPMQSGGMPSRDYRHSYPDGPEDIGPQISADLDDIGSDDEEIHHIEIRRDETGFGFSIRGGAEYHSSLFVLRIAEGGAAEKEGRLQVGDELLEINGNSTEGMFHADAITIIKHGGDYVKLIVRRVSGHHHHVGGYVDSQNAQVGPYGSPPREYPSSFHSDPNSRSNSQSREMLNSVKSPAASSAHERYTREYMNSLTRQRAGEGHQEEPREEAQMWEQYNPDGMGDPTHGIMGDFSNE